MLINSEEQLRNLYGYPNDRAVGKALRTLDKHALNYISKSPFVILSTVSSDRKVDASPRGGAAGFVQVLNGKVAIPDYKGNNRLDSLENIVETGQVGLLFMIPGIDETLRVNGKATLSTDEEVLRQFKSEFKPPLSVILIEVEEFFLHCAKAFMRSKLWDPTVQLDKKEFPSMGQMLKDQLQSSDEAESREDMEKRYRENL